MFFLSNNLSLDMISACKILYIFYVKYIMSHIIDNLYLGSIEDFNNNEFMKNIDITIKLTNLSEELDKLTNLSEESEFNKDNIYRVPLDDFEEFPIHEYIDEALKYINYNQNKNILIQCKAGRSRSVTVLIAYLILYKKYSYKDALNLIKEKRNIKINKGFEKYLKSLDPNEEQECLICYGKYCGRHDCQYKKCACGKLIKKYESCIKKCFACNQFIDCKMIREHLLYCTL